MSNPKTTPKSNSLSDGDGIIALDRSLKIMSCNPVATDILGIELEPRDQFPLKTICDKTSSRKLETALRLTIDKGRSYSGLKLHHSDAKGTKTCMNLSIQPLYNHPKNIIGVILSIQPFGKFNSSFFSILF